MNTYVENKYPAEVWIRDTIVLSKGEVSPEMFVGKPIIKDGIPVGVIKDARISGNDILMRANVRSDLIEPEGARHKRSC